MKRLRILGILVGICASASAAAAQQTARDSALTLSDRGLHREALPLLEQLAASGTPDRVVFTALGFALITTAGALPDAGVRKQQRARARSFFAKAVALGSSDLQVQAMMQIPEDGGNDAVFSGNGAVDEAMKGAEAAYSARDFRRALTGYQRALTLDPGLYWAAVFSGDAYLALTQVDSAYVWYARATQINPNSETAWRYWSDVLLKHDDVDQAREKAIESIVAEPFNRISRQALLEWARKTGSPLATVRVDFPPQPPAGAPSPARVAYDSVRRAWRGDGPTMAAPFVAQYPTETQYRHSLTEEKLALQAAYRAAGDDAATVNLRRLDEAGMLEAYILFGRADAGIAADYETWRRDHRDALKRYWSEFVIGGRSAR